MKLDHDLTRQLLLHIEEITDGNSGYPAAGFAASFPEYAPGIVRYHVKYLMDAALVEHNNNEIYDISPKGRESLDSIRSPENWKKTKATAAKQALGQLSFDVMVEIAKGLILKSFTL